MSRRNRRGIMSEDFKSELAKDLGFYETVQREGWGGIKAKDAGNMVKRAIQIAEQTLSNQQSAHTSASYQPAAYQQQPQQTMQSSRSGYNPMPSSVYAVRTNPVAQTGNPAQPSFMHSSYGQQSPYNTVGQPGVQ